MDQQETTDEDAQLLAEQEEYETRLSPNNDTVVQLLSSLNANMCSMSESLKRLHEANDPHRDGVATAEISAKKAKLAHDSQNKSEDSESDSELLLDDERRTNVTVETSTSQDGAQNDKPSDNALLEEIAQSLDETEPTGLAVHDKLAQIVNKRWLNKLGDDQLKDKLDKHLRPVNCEQVLVPRVNPEIWAKLPNVVRGADTKLSRIQNQLCKAAYITLKTTDALLTAQSQSKDIDINSLVRMNTDALALMSHMSYDLSVRRRDNIRPHLNKGYLGLCSPSGPITDSLFGNDLQTELTRIKATNKIGNTSTTPSSSSTGWP
jgi:hypothetical protein